MNNGSLVYKVSNAPREESSFTLYTINKIAKIGKQQPLLESPFSDDALFKRSLVFFFRDKICGEKLHTAFSAWAFDVLHP